MEKENLKLLTRKEVSQKLRVSYPTLAKWREKNILPACILGTRIRYKQSDIDSLLNSKSLGL
jgi:excisionase family DNA binding protein